MTATVTQIKAECRRARCPRPSENRGLCTSHYRELLRQEAKARSRARVKAEGEVPANGLGVLRCAVCNVVLASVPVSHSCLARAVDRI